MFLLNDTTSSNEKGFLESLQPDGKLFNLSLTYSDSSKLSFLQALTETDDTDPFSNFRVLLSVPDTPDYYGEADLSQNVLDYYPSTSPFPILSGVTHPSNWNSFPTLKPALQSTVQLSLTCVYITIFGIIFILAYVQLWIIWYFRHKRFSHQTLFLSLCLVWSGLRTSLFSFYFNNCDTANDLPTGFYWLLYSFPVCLQFAMLCLLLHFFAMVVCKANRSYEPGKYKRPLRIFLLLSVLGFSAMNLSCAILTKHYENVNYLPPQDILFVRVGITESMFLIYAVLLCVCIYKMAKAASIRRVLEARGTSVKKAVLATILITSLFLSRTVYNLICIFSAMGNMANFGFGWMNVSDQADTVPGLDRNWAYISFGIVLFVWEALPTFIIVAYFRVKIHRNEPVLTDFSTQQHGPRVFFFDNPRRYDSEDDLTDQGSTPTPANVPGSRSINGDSTPNGTPTVYGSVGSRPHVSSPLSTHSYGGRGDGRASYGSLQASQDHRKMIV